MTLEETKKRLKEGMIKGIVPSMSQEELDILANKVQTIRDNNERYAEEERLKKSGNNTTNSKQKLYRSKQRAS